MRTLLKMVLGKMWHPLSLGAKMLSVFIYGGMFILIIVLICLDHKYSVGIFRD